MRGHWGKRASFQLFNPWAGASGGLTHDDYFTELRTEAECWKVEALSAGLREVPFGME